ncbi:hypothetical protein [Bizionia sp.]|uniref:hypothetical protein n=1 Tax=Bizionia sp. TaxID=1954480 RepID=UPI003A8E537C
MRFKRLFFDSSFESIKLSDKRIILGILIGLSTAFALYGFMYLLRDTFRLLTFSFGYLPNILSEFERNTFNWFFAALAFVFGNSITMSIIFSGHTYGFGKRNYKKRRIINNQTALNSVFAYWFAKVSYVIAFVSMGMADLNFLPEISIPLILLVLVLYLETWKTQSLYLGKGKFKWMLLHFLLLFILSFALSKVHFVNYKELDAIQLKYNPQIDFPNSNFSNTSNYDRFVNATLVRDNPNVILFNSYENKLDQAYLDFLDFKLSRSYRFQYLSARLLADADTEMKQIVAVRKQVLKGSINNIIYATLNKDQHSKRFIFPGLKVKIYDQQVFEAKTFSPIRLNLDSLDLEKNYKPKDTIKIRIANGFILNGRQIPTDMLMKEIAKYINQKTIFEYSYPGNAKYQNYITLLSSHLNALKTVRDKNRRVELEWNDENFTFKNKKQFAKDQARLYDEFPFRVTEKIDYD